MTKQTRFGAWLLAGVIGCGLVTPMAAEAGSKGRRNTALVLGAVAAYGIIKKKPALAGIAGAGAVYSYVSSRNAAKKERERDRWRRRHRYARYRGGRHYGGYHRSHYRHASYHGKHYGRGRYCD